MILILYFIRRSQRRETFQLGIVKFSQRNGKIKDRRGKGWKERSDIMCQINWRINNYLKIKRIITLGLVTVKNCICLTIQIIVLLVKYQVKGHYSSLFNYIAVVIWTVDSKFEDVIITHTLCIVVFKYGNQNYVTSIYFRRLKKRR